MFEVRKEDSKAPCHGAPVYPRQAGTIVAACEAHLAYDLCTATVTTRGHHAYMDPSGTLSYCAFHFSYMNYS